MSDTTYIECVDVFSWSIDNDNYMFTAHLMTSEGETIIDIPLHEDFLDLVLVLPRGIQKTHQQKNQQPTMTTIQKQIQHPS